MNKLNKILLTFVVALLAIIVLPSGNSTSFAQQQYVTPTPTCTPTPTPTDTPTPTPTCTPTPTPTPPCQLNQQGLCIHIQCDGGGDCEFNTTTPTPTPTPTQAPTITPTVPPAGHGDGLSDGRSSGGGSSSTPTQAVLGSMAPTGSFVKNVMDFMLLSGVLILSFIGYLSYGKKKKA